MKTGWELKDISNVTFIQEGPGIRKYEYQEDGYPMINVRCVQNGYIDMSNGRAANTELAKGKWKHFQIDEGDILFTISGTIGRCAMVEADDLPLLMNTSVVRFKSIDSQLDSRFLYLFLQSDGFQHPLKLLSGGTAIQNVGPTHIKTLSIPLPPLEEQKRIVSILDEAFKGLDRARENAEANLKSAGELFSEAIRLNLRERDNWVSAKLSKCFRLKSGDNLTSKSMVSGPFEVYGGNGVAGKHNASNLSGDNVIVGRVGALCGRARCISDDIWLTDNAFKVVDYKYDFEPRFLARLLNFLNLGSLARQAAQPVISNSSLKDLILQFPKERSKQTAIADNLDKYEFKIDTARGHYQTKLQDISDLRQSLLQKAFSGELT